MVANADGLYSLPNLAVGPYTLEVTASGFKTYTQSGIVLQVGANVQINVSMTVGAVTENVTVNASAGLVETQSNTIAQVILGNFRTAGAEDAADLSFAVERQLRAPVQAAMGSFGQLYRKQNHSPPSGTPAKLPHLLAGRNLSSG